MLSEAVIPFDQAIQVESVAQEYGLIRRQRCDCGGRFRLTRQALLTHENVRYDLIEVRCVACREARTFLFNVSRFFGANMASGQEA